MTRRQLAHMCILMNLCALVSPSGAHPQVAGSAVLRGYVVADSAGGPVADAEITMVESGRRVRSNNSGEFEIRGISSGVFTVRVRHPHFKMREDTVRMGASDTLNVRIALSPVALTLPSVTVRGQAEKLESPLLVDFRRRRETTNGKFLTAAEIRQIGSQSLVNIVRGHIGGFDLVRHPSGVGTAFASRRQAAPRLDRPPTGRPNECYSNVWINGQLVYYSSRVREDPPRIEDFEVNRLNGLEFYRGASETPIELNVMSAACGTVVIWMDLGDGLLMTHGVDIAPEHLHEQARVTA